LDYPENLSEKNQEKTVAGRVFVLGLSCACLSGKAKVREDSRGLFAAPPEN
jgi:hypothetical protein